MDATKFTANLNFTSSIKLVLCNTLIGQDNVFDISSSIAAIEFEGYAVSNWFVHQMKQKLPSLVIKRQ